MIAVVSPHLDDGVFGCGALLSARPGSVVITVFAGRPPRHGLTQWDAACGFSADDDVIGARRAEDRAALSLLGATPVWLDFCDAQYAAPPSIDALREAIQEAIARARPEAVFIPLGLFHGDHRLVADAALPLARAGAPAPHAYAEAMYRVIPRLTGEALSRLAALGISATPADIPVPAGSQARKRAAVHCYRSQLRGLGTPGRPGHEDVFAPETFWRLSHGSLEPSHGVDPHARPQR